MIILKTILTCIVALAGSFTHSKEANNPSTDLPMKEELKVGQVWKYHNRAGEDKSTLTILKIEKYEKGDTIIHIRIDGVKIHSPQSATGYSEYIGHLPFSKKAITSSITTFAGTKNNLPDFSEGYNHWKKAWDEGKGGYWTTDIKEAIDAVDKMMQK